MAIASRPGLTQSERGPSISWYRLPAEEVVAYLRVDPARTLGAAGR